MAGPEEVEHPKPTLATIRELYAHAFACAHPGCGEWLYRQEPGSAKPVLNSRVAHIHARKPRGPRWQRGMSAADNRSAENLLLLCIPHSYEVDGDEDRFPAEMLQEWRVAQRQEVLDSRQAWTIDEDQASDVSRESFGSPTVAAPVLASVVRAAERLVIRAISTRSEPAAVAAAWRAARERTRSSFVAWDDEGNRVYAEPSRGERERHEAAVLNALHAVRAQVGPLSEDLLAEVATARYVSPRTGLWCDWLVRATEELMAAASVWNWTPPFEDDDRLGYAADEVRRASEALAAALRGENPNLPPAVSTPAVGGPSADDRASADALTRHDELLERARPWARVKTRPYDIAMRAELVKAADEAATVPPVLATLAFGLDATAGLAAAVARNGTDEEVAALIELDRSHRPLVVAAALLVELWRVMEDQGRNALADRVRDAFVEEMTRHDWASEDGWAGNKVCGPRNPWWHFVSPDAPKDALSAALNAAPERLDDVVLGCAGWVQRESSSDGSVSFARSYRELLPWFPTNAVVRAAAMRYPHVTATTSTYDDGAVDGMPEIEHLLRHILRMAT
jgi:hypothetical protein